MRISDWSSDVCSSDLAGLEALRIEQRQMHARTETPDAAATIEQRVEADRLIASERLEAEVRIERRFGRSTTGGCGIDASAGREHIGAMREQIDRQILWQWQHGIDRKSTRLNYSHECASPMP